ncbi:MAG: hypothetical protein R6U44_06620 [Archaeoglobaceae archaeon]
MDVRSDVGLVVIMVFSSVMLTYNWLLLYDRVSSAVMFFAFLLTLSLGALIISLILRMKEVMEEFESTKRAIAVNTDDLESRIDSKLQAYIDPLEGRLDRMERRSYR